MSLLTLAERLMPHLLLAPILLPMLTAALMLTLGEKYQRTKLLMTLKNKLSVKMVGMKLRVK